MESESAKVGFSDQELLPAGPEMQRKQQRHFGGSHSNYFQICQCLSASSGLVNCCSNFILTYCSFWHRLTDETMLCVGRGMFFFFLPAAQVAPTSRQLSQGIVMKREEPPKPSNSAGKKPLQANR